jgi:hypothetical protein
MHTAAHFANGGVHREDSSVKPLLHATFEPCFEILRFLPVFFPGQFDAQPDFENRDGTEKTRLRLLCRLPSSHADIASRGFAQFGDNVRIEKEQGSILQHGRARLLGETRELQLHGPCFFVPEYFEQRFLRPSANWRETQPLADQLRNPSRERQICIYRTVPGLAAKGVLQFDSHIHNCTVARLHDIVKGFGKLKKTVSTRTTEPTNQNDALDTGTVTWTVCRKSM